MPKPRTITSALAAMLSITLAHADEPPNRLERTAKKAGAAVDRAVQRSEKWTEETVDRAGKWANRTGTRASQAVENAADKTESWVKKKTQ